MKIHLISYGDDNYAIQRKFLKETAISSEFFDHIQIFTQNHIDPDFNQHVYKFVRYQRGGGFWVWKPYFIKKVLDTLDEDDILCYCDAGCIINGWAKPRFREYVEILRQSKTGSIDFELPFKEYQYTKSEVFSYYQTPEEVINTNQLMATVILLRKCTHSQMLVQKWYDTVMTDFSLFTDEIVLPQRAGFIDHRHDQSIFSVIRKTWGANIIPDETYFLDFPKEGQNFPFWATRLRG